MEHISMYKNFTEEKIEGSNIKNFTCFDENNYKEIIDIHGINFQDTNHETALMWACRCENVEVIRLLLNYDK